ncbi:hypothetical protein SK128_001780 [Halocaridina rubra]|uniref:Uncharacterized protein n=1 Tax=Halocaridina rubra TaxID=373956 RepID=A0AAN8WH71_HALRR
MMDPATQPVTYPSGTTSGAQHCGTNKTDSGLSLLLTLYHFLRNVCADAAFHLFIKGFKNSKYQDLINPDTIEVSGRVSFYDFLVDVQQCGRRKDKTSQKLKSSGSSKRTTQIHDLNEHTDTLKAVSLEDLINGDEELCQPLRELDLAFVLNVIANEYVHYAIDDNVLNAVCSIKEVRNKLFHPKYNFNLKDFDYYMNELLCSTVVLYHHLDPNTPLNRDRLVSESHKQILQANIGPHILGQLKWEIHQRYVKLPYFVHPLITDIRNRVVIEDFSVYILQQSANSSNVVAPMLLCGAPGTGNSTLLKNVAYSLSHQRENNSDSEFQLVLYLDEWNRKSNHQLGTPPVNNSSEFWDQIFKCIRVLAQNTVNTYGLESVKVVIREYIREILFLVNWNSLSLGSLFKDMQLGTWVVAYQEQAPSTENWQVLKIYSFTENMVIQFLKKYVLQCPEDIISLYNNCQYKELLKSPDLIKVFAELNSTTRGFGTDFELVEAFFEKKVRSYMHNQNYKTEFLTLGEVAFNGLKNGGKYVQKRSNVNIVNGDLKSQFLTFEEGKGLYFIHSVVQEFLAAKYAVLMPKEARNGWLLNPPFFMRTFKFACGLWCKDGAELGYKTVDYINEYLIRLFEIWIPDLERYQEVDEAMEVDEECNQVRNKRETIVEKGVISQNVHKNPFTKWDYMIEIDEVCRHPHILKLFADLLSRIPIWIFQSNTINQWRFNRINKILNKVHLHEKSPITIKIDRDVDVAKLKLVWNNLKNIKSLFNCALIKISVLKPKTYPYVVEDSLLDLCNAIVRSHSPIFLTSYEGPFLCSRTPEFFKCTCVVNLSHIDVVVYDFASLCEIFKCAALPSLMTLIVSVDFKKLEHELEHLCQIKLPEHKSFTLRIRYFDKVQKFLNSVVNPEVLLTLSVYDVYIHDKFILDLSAFENLNSLNIRCEPNEVEHKKNVLPSEIRFTEQGCQEVTGNEAMDTDDASSCVSYPMEGNASLGVPEPMSDDASSNVLDLNGTRVPRQSWMLPLAVSLKLPRMLQRLLFRNMDFFNISNNYLIGNFLNKCCIQKLIILDSHLSLRGVRQVLCSHTSNGCEDIEGMTKRLKEDRSESGILRKLVCKRPRMSAEERERKRLKKPKGKEVVITSSVGICKECSFFPCHCVNFDPIEGKDTLEDLIFLIEDVYEYDIVSFSYTSNIITVSKNVCGDLRFRCSLPELNDGVASSLKTMNDWLNRLFMTLTLAHNICLEKTNLSFDGLMLVIAYLKAVKTMYSHENVIEPFSLLISTSFHPSDDATVEQFKENIKSEIVLISCNVHCSCENKCYKIKKTYSGKIFYNDCLVESKILSKSSHK